MASEGPLGGYNEAEGQLQTSVPFGTRRFCDLARTVTDVGGGVVAIVSVAV